MPDPALLSFTPSPAMTLGVEVELQVLDPSTRNLTPGAPQLLERLAHNSRIRAELLQSMIEINTGICANVTEVRRDLSDAIAQLREAGRDLGVTYSAAGSHPFALWSERRVSSGERFQTLIDRNRWLARRLMIFGLHIHVGMRDGAHAVAMLNGMLPYVPYTLALSASSPFWEGQDTGLASSRITLFEALPTAGHPCTFRSWEEFQAMYRAMYRSRAVTSIKDFWWDIRLHPDFGTLELRICDGLSTLSEIVAMVAFVQVLYAKLDAEYRAGRVFDPPSDWILRENKWRASRWGLEAELVEDAGGRTSLVRESVARLLPTLAPLAASLGCAAELARLGGILEGGASYERQRRVFARQESLRDVVDAMAQELETDTPAGAD